MNSSLHKRVKSVFLLALFSILLISFFSKKGFTQSFLPVATELKHLPECEPYEFFVKGGTPEVWFYFAAVDSVAKIEFLESVSNNPDAAFSEISLYDGTSGSLIFIKTSSGNTIYYDSLTIGNKYYLKAIPISEGYCQVCLSVKVFSTPKVFIDYGVLYAVSNERFNLRNSPTLGSSNHNVQSPNFYTMPPLTNFQGSPTIIGNSAQITKAFLFFTAVGGFTSVFQIPASYNIQINGVTVSANLCSEPGISGYVDNGTCWMSGTFTGYTLFYQADITYLVTANPNGPFTISGLPQNPNTPSTGNCGSQYQHCIDADGATIFIVYKDRCINSNKSALYLFPNEHYVTKQMVDQSHEIRVTSPFPNDIINPGHQFILNGDRETNDINLESTWSVDDLSVPSQPFSTVANFWNFDYLSQNYISGTYRAYNTNKTKSDCIAVGPVGLYYQTKDVYTVTVNAGPDKKVCKGESVQLSVEIDGVNCPSNFSYQWSPAGDIPNPNSCSITVSPAQTTTYTVTVTDQFGCQYTDETIVTIIDYSVSHDILGFNNTCDGHTIVYEITGYDPIAQYNWSITCGSPSTIVVSPNGQYATVTWANSGCLSFSVPQQVIVNVIYSETCQFTLSKDVFECCGYESCGNGNNIVSNTSIHSISPTISNITFNGDIYITGSLSLPTYVFMGQNTRIFIQPGCAVDIENSVVKACCGYMWDGFYLSDPTASIIIRNSIICDGINPIVASKNSKVDIWDSKFYNNYNGVLVKDFYQPGTPSNSTIYGTEFSTSNTSYSACNYLMLSNVLALPPYLNQRAYAGFQAESIYDLTIGNPSMQRNTFRDLRFGIRLKNTNAKIWNNTFDDIFLWYGVYSNPASQSASVYSERTLSDKVYLTLEVGNYGNKKNEFIRHTQYGIYSWGITPTIVNNYFQIALAAIQCYEVKSPTLIRSNNIEQGTWKDNEFSINVANAMTTNKGLKVTIDQNTVSSLRGGIYVARLNSYGPNNYVKIGNNEIDITPIGAPSGWLYSTGIHVINCKGIQVGMNEVKKNGPPPNATMLYKIKGIVSESTLDGTFNDNIIRNFGAGINVVYLNTNTQFSCNEMNKCYDGFYFSNAVVSNQGGTTRASDNTWTPAMWAGWNYRVDGGFNMLAPSINWYFRNSLANNNKFSLEPTIVLPSHPMYLHIFPTQNTNVGSTCISNNGNNNGNGTIAALREEKFGKILRDEINYNNWIEESKFFNKKYLYSELLGDTNLIFIGEPDDIDYAQFLIDNASTNVGLLYQIYDKSDSGLFELAESINQTFFETEHFESNLKIVNSIYLKSWAYRSNFIDSLQKQLLQLIAYEDPKEGGDAVYEARVMLGLIIEDSLTNNRKISNFINNSGTLSFTIYPNPAREEISLNFENVINENVIIKIYNALNNEVISPAFVYNGEIIRIKTDLLKPGVYWVKVYSSKEIFEIGKFIIIQ